MVSVKIKRFYFFPYEYIMDTYFAIKWVNVKLWSPFYKRGRDLIPIKDVKMVNGRTDDGGIWCSSFKCEPLAQMR